MLVLGSVLYFYRVRLLKHYSPTVHKVGNMKMSIINDTTFVTAKIAVKNNIFLKINIDTIKYKVSLFDKVYINDETFVGLVLPGNGSDTMGFILKIPHTIIMNDLKKERKRADSASYSIDVSIKYSSIFGDSEFPFVKSSKLKIPQAPKIEVVDITYEKIRLKSLLAFIKITNHSPFTLILNNIRYFIDIPEMGNLKGNYSKNLEIKPRGTSYVTLKVKIEINNLVKTAFQILFNKDTYSYTLRMNANLESVYPFQETFEVDLVNYGKMELKK